MKRKVVEVDAMAHRRDRALGDAPHLGRPVKLAGSGSSDAVSPEAVTDEEDEPLEPESGEWLIRLGMVSALLIALIVGGGLIYYTASKQLGSAPSGHPVPEQDSHETMGKDEVSDEGMISEFEALDLVRRGLAVRFVSNVTNFFCFNRTFDPPEAVNFLKGLSETDGLVVGMEYLSPIEKGGQSIARVRVHSKAGENRTYRDAYLMKNPDGEWKIDFDSFANRTEPDWNRIFPAPSEDDGF